MCILDRVRLAEFFLTPLTICTTVFPHLMTFCIRLMFNPVSVGKKGLVQFSPSTKKQRLHDSWQGKVGWVIPHPINHMHNSFHPPVNLHLVRVEKEWAGPVFPNPFKSKGCMCIHDRVRLAVFFPQTINHVHNSFPPPDNFLNKVDV